MYGAGERCAGLWRMLLHVRVSGRNLPAFRRNLREWQQSKTATMDPGFFEGGERYRNAPRAAHACPRRVDVFHQPILAYDSFNISTLPKHASAAEAMASLGGGEGSPLAAVAWDVSVDFAPANHHIIIDHAADLLGAFVVEGNPEKIEVLLGGTVVASGKRDVERAFARLPILLVAMTYHAAALLVETTTDVRVTWTYAALLRDDTRARMNEEMATYKYEDVCGLTYGEGMCGLEKDRMGG
jgi:hypothetical protein